MTSACTLLHDLGRQGVELRPDGDRLSFRPASRVTPEQVAQLREHKQVLLNWLIHGDPYLEPGEVDDGIRWIRPPAEKWCRGCRDIEAQGVRVLHCGTCDVEVLA